MNAPNLDAYREAVRQRAAVAAKSAAISARIEKLVPLRQAPAAAQAVLDDLKAQETAALAEWANAGAEGTPPQTKAAARDKAAKAFADAEYAAAGAETVIRGLEEQLTTLHSTEWLSAAAAVNQTQAEVLGDEWLRSFDEVFEANMKLEVAKRRQAHLYAQMFAANKAVATARIGARHQKITEGAYTVRMNDAIREADEDFAKWNAETFGGTESDPSQAA